jgi:60 kDa SS-A/Ro ribonucleoprotein
MANNNYTNQLNNLMNSSANTGSDVFVATSPDMVKNNSGAYVYEISPKQLLRRALIMGAPGGNSFYEKGDVIFQRFLTTIQDNLNRNGVETVMEIVEVSINNLAPKNDACVFALAVAGSDTTNANLETRQLALSFVPQVCRTPTELFAFIEFSRQLRGFGPSLRKAVNRWYAAKGYGVAYPVLKYRSRNGMSHRDVFRLTHPKFEDQDMNGFVAFVNNDNKGELRDGRIYTTQRLRKESREAVLETREVSFSTEGQFRIAEGFLRMQAATTAREVISLIAEYNIPWEMIPTEFASNPDVQMALLPGMGITSLVRMLGRYTASGVIAPFSESVKVIEAKFADPRNLAKMHPVNILAAMKMYNRGFGDKSALRWNAVTAISSALDSAVYESFKYITPTGKNFFLGVDISGSMSWESLIPTLNCREIAMTMAIATVRSEKNCEVFALTNSTLTPLHIKQDESIDSLIQRTNGMSFGSTGLAQVIEHAHKNRIPVDAFGIYTDNEINAGGHPSSAFKKFRNDVNPEARFFVNAMTLTNFSIADSKDPYQIDFPGFDSSTPSLVSTFVRGEL